MQDNQEPADEGTCYPIVKGMCSRVFSWIVAMLLALMLCVVAFEIEGLFKEDLIYVAGVHVEQKNETVILLHGVAKSSKDMVPIEHALKSSGYKVINLSYPSCKMSIADLAVHLYENDLSPKFWGSLGTGDKVHFVTHSMGGLVARTFLEYYKDEIPYERVGRVVMLGPPNQGSEVSDLIHRIPVYKWYYGPAGQDLTTSHQGSIIPALPYYELGIIAGTKKWFYPVSALLLKGSADGRVTVENTKINGMADHITVSATHTFIMDKPDVHQHILYFLERGVFNHGED